MQRRVIGGWGFRADLLSHLGPAQPWHAELHLDAPTLLIGWSLGGVVATELLDHPEVVAVVTLATPGDFAAQVDPRFFNRLARSVAHDSEAALARFHPWIVGEPFDPRRVDDHQLLGGLTRLRDSRCADAWARSATPQLHLVGQDDVLFRDPDQQPVTGGHGFAWQQAERTAALIDEFADAL
ncbi:MAG: alpha/beta fold hydrolase [Litorivicinus sp.]